MVRFLARVIPHRPVPGLFAGTGLLLVGLLVALLLAGALAALLGVLGREPPWVYLQLLAVPALAIGASSWIVAVVSQVGIVTGRAPLGFLSYLLLAAPVAAAWAVPGIRASFAPVLVATVGIGIIPAWLGVQLARTTLKGSGQ